MTDGASANFGHKQEVSTLLKQQSPWLISVHCFNHRFELAIKDALDKTFMDDIVNLLNNLYAIYNQSPKKLTGLQELGDALGKCCKPQRVNGTSWVAFKLKAIRALLKSYSILLEHLQSMVDNRETKSVDKAKYMGLLKQLKSFKYIVHLLFFSNLLQPLSRFSEQLQGDSIDMLYAISSIEGINNTLDKAINSDELKQIIAAADDITENESEDEEVVTVKYKDTILTGVCVGMKHFKANSGRYTQAVKDSLRARYSDVLSESSVFRVLKLLDISSWPVNETIADFGNKEIDCFIQHFSELLSKHNVATENIMGEWNEIKYFHKLFNILDRHAFWQLVLEKHSQRFPNLKHVIQILLLYPVSNAKVERLFSTMKRVKNDWRASLDEQTLEQLLRIRAEGPSLADFDPLPVVNKFLAMPSRHGTHKLIESRKRKADFGDNENLKLETPNSDDEFSNDEIAD